MSVNRSFAQKSRTFTDGDSIRVLWNANPDSEHVFEYRIHYAYSGNVVSVMDTFKIFPDLSDTTEFYVTAINCAGESEPSDTVWAFYIPPEAPPLPTDIPYSATASEIWTGWSKFGCGAYHDTSGAASTICFWTNRESQLALTYIWTDIDFGETTDYLFSAIMSRWGAGEAYLVIDDTEYKIDMTETTAVKYTKIVHVPAGTHRVFWRCRVYPIFLYDFSIGFANLKPPGKVSGLGIIKE